MSTAESNRATPTCFVIMPFQDPFNYYYDEIIKPAGQKAGFMTQRADDIMGPGAFMQDVANGMKDATVIIAELTGRNPNVFYELGLAHAWGKPVIMLTQRREDVPSDLLALKWIFYSTVLPTWAEKLANDIISALRAVKGGDRKALLFPFIHPSVSIGGGDLLDKLSQMSGTQKQILDYIRGVEQPVNQRIIERQFSLLSAAEVFYRLDNLRLLGFISSREVTKDLVGKGIYSFELTAAAREIFP